MSKFRRPILKLLRLRGKEKHGKSGTKNRDFQIYSEIYARRVMLIELYLITVYTLSDKAQKY